MLIGEHIHTLDTKKRLSLPAKFRKALGKKVVVTRGLDNCLFVYPLAKWKIEAEKLVNLHSGQADIRGFQRHMLAGAVESDIDSLGRILIPDFLKDFASLSTKVAVIGVHDRVELWNEKKWSVYKSKIEKQADVLAEKLGVEGMY